MPPSRLRPATFQVLSSYMSCCCFVLGPGMNALGADLSPILREKPSPAYISHTSQTAEIWVRYKCTHCAWLCVSVVLWLLVTQHKLTDTASNHNLTPIYLCSLSVPWIPTPDSWLQLQSFCWPLHPAFEVYSPSQVPVTGGSRKL